jgi:hypothetical protein
MNKAPKRFLNSDECKEFIAAAEELRLKLQMIVGQDTRQCTGRHRVDVFIEQAALKFHCVLFELSIERALDFVYPFGALEPKIRANT